MMKQAVQEIGSHTNMMPRERGMTLPMVKAENGALIVRRLIYFTRAVPGEDTQITQPQYVAEYDLTKGKFITMAKFDLELGGLQDPPWTHNRPAFANAEDIIPEFDRIWSLYDVLISAYARRASGNDKKLQGFAGEYLKYFNRHAEKPLLPYYRHYGGDFLAWVERISKGDK